MSAMDEYKTTLAGLSSSERRRLHLNYWTIQETCVDTSDLTICNGVQRYVELDFASESAVTGPTLDFQIWRRAKK